MKRYRFDLTIDESPAVDLVIEVDTPEQLAAIVATLMGEGHADPS